MLAKWASALFALVFANTISVQALACSYTPPPLNETAREIASVGFVIYGTVIQSIDVSAHKELIIRSDKTFVGDPQLRSFVIYYTTDEYQMLTDSSLIKTSCEHAAKNYPVGYRGVFILEPAVNMTGDQTVSGRWTESMFGGTLLHNRSWPLLKEAATETGRLLVLPPILP